MKTPEEKRQKKVSRRRALLYTFVGAFILGNLFTSFEIYWLSEPKPENLHSFIAPVVFNVVGAIVSIVCGNIGISSGKKEKDPKEL